MATTTTTTPPAPPPPAQAPHDYRLIKEFPPPSASSTARTGLYLIERAADNRRFLGATWTIEQTDPAFAGLLDRGAGTALGAVLNHPNLVSHIGLHTARFWHGSLDSELQTFALTDYCDAGTLRNFLDKTPVLAKTTTILRDGGGVPAVQQWLPESLVWHVATSALGALAWLHEGVRVEDAIEWAADGTPTRGVVREGPADRDGGEEWLAILHRDVRADQVFFQHPRGVETYGLCKLGGYGKVVVSGHVHGRALGGPIATENEDEDAARAEVVLKQTVARAEARTAAHRTRVEGDLSVDDDVVWTENYDDLAKEDRPYMKGTEAFKVGAILYQMMTRQVLPDYEECPATITTRHGPPRPCGTRHWEEASTNEPTTCPIMPSGTVFDLEDSLQALTAGFDAAEPTLGYTRELVDLVARLLGNYRRSVDTEGLLMLARRGYEQWKATTVEGGVHVDLWDDMVQREQNRRRKDAAEVEVAVRQSGPRAKEYIGKALGGIKAVPIQGSRA